MCTAVVTVTVTWGGCAGVGGADAGGGEQYGWRAQGGGLGRHCCHHHGHAGPRHHQGSLTQVSPRTLSFTCVLQAHNIALEIL